MKKYIKAEIPDPRPEAWSEADRLKAIESYEILDTPAEEDYDDIVKLAAGLCDMPVSMISIVADGRQWFKAGVGVAVRETSLEASICKHAIRQRGLFVVPDTTKDARFHKNPDVTGGPKYRFYAGALLETPDGLPIGTLCLLDYKPRHLTEKEAFALKTLARLVMTQLELRRGLNAKLRDKEKLSASELSYRRLFEAARDGILLLDFATGCVTDANAYLEELLGFSHDEMIGRTVGELSPFKDLVSNEAVLERLQQENYIRYDNLPLETKDGRHIDVEFVCNVYQAGDKQVIQCNIRDITKRKTVEKQLLQKTAFFEAQVHSSLDAIIIVDSEGKLLLQNKQMAALWSAPKEIIEDTDHRRRLEWVVRQVNKPEQFAEKVDHLYAHPNEISRDEINLINGKCLDRYTAPVLAVDGRYFGRIWTYRDITDRKRMESRFRRLVDSNAQSVFFYERKGRVSGANGAFLKLVGYTREDLEAGQINWMDMTPPEYGDREREILAKLDTAGVCGPYEKEFIRKDGSRIPILIGAASFEDNPDEGVVFVLDLTERKKLEQQFLRAQRMESIGTLAGGIAHDLNNILAPIMLSIDILKSTSKDPQARRILSTIEISAKQGADIVRQVLSFARGMDGEKIEISPKHLLKDLESILKSTFPKNIRMDFSVPKGVWPILGDPTQIHQILLNLGVNARDAMPNGGCLSVEAKNCELDEHYVTMNSEAKPGRYVQINVTDNGMGMPKEIINKIFEPFFTTKEMGKGTGLGLSTVIAVVKSHEGLINVYSEPGKGTTFKLYFPAIEMPSERKAKALPDASLPRGNGETILVIDDESSILALTGQTLEAFGYRVLTAINGAVAAAVYAAHQEEIAAVLTDMMMPVMDGSATIHALRRINPLIKIIAASGFSPNASVTKVDESCVKYFLNKPYTASTLLQALRTVLDEA